MVIRNPVGLPSNRNGFGIKGPNPFGQNLIAESVAMKQLVSRALRFAENDELKVVLISGPTGSGKNELAKLIHRASLRREKPFISVNCAAIPRELQESELFGHIRGSFTGAVDNRDGLFTAAQGGFIFLNEINETDQNFQRKLLGVFDDLEIRQIGSSMPTKLNARIIVGSSRDLKEMVKEKEFIEPLYYRICAISIIIPSLCQRIEDIQPLAEKFIRKYNSGVMAEISPEALSLFKAYTWPGNVRELENEIQRIIFDNERLTTIWPEHLSPQIQRGVTFETCQELPMKMEREHIAQVLKASGGNRSLAARILRIPRSTLQSKIERFGLTDFRQN